MLKEAFNLEAFDNLRNVLILILMEHAQRAVRVKPTHIY